MVGKSRGERGQGSVGSKQSLPTFDSKGAFPKGPAKFSDAAEKMLLDLGLFPSQIRQLERMALPSIRWRIHPSPPMSNVREKLSDLSRFLDKAERAYVRLSAPTSPASAEALTRLYVAQERLDVPTDTLHDSLQQATHIVRRALLDVPSAQRRRRRADGEFIRLILKALELGHVEHHRCVGYGEKPSRKGMPPFEILVSRKGTIPEYFANRLGRDWWMER